MDSFEVTNSIRLGKLTINFLSGTIIGPYDRDSIPVKYYELMVERFSEPDVMFWECPFYFAPERDSEDGTRRIMKLNIAKRYRYVQI